ncbi:hypothetical protein tinsulaeT_37680 [Thalassotalea insulae]|uniref:Uncharacterized protein n=1 Tax=Thalassotalea insulae TaxID=2056778 RepID=A0ABQ6GWX1_9GAMM|nr:hypothetical protein [Thalassotalea insulae]GLX80428.1 hypothetical protein tinsulaeT_37680 [Thalassotalea insulae]
MGANVNICFRIAIVNQLIFLLLTYINITDCSTSPYGCSKGEGLLQGLAYIAIFSLLALVETIMLLGIFSTIFDKSFLKATQLNIFAFLVTFILCLYTVLNWHYAHM